MVLDICNLTQTKIEKKFFQNILAFVSKRKPILCDFEISLVLLGDAEMQKINKEQRGKNRPTDVLSFNLGLGLAEIFICLERARLQAKRLGHPLERELALLFVHGLLHVLGYDDEDAAERKKMFKEQSAILKSVLT